jgi:hypothetical protein
MTTPYRAAIDHVLAARRELEAAGRALPARDEPVELELSRALTAVGAALWALREREPPTEPEAACATCGHPLYLGTCVRCWARKEMGGRP